jgi:hypothetical protein
MKKVNRNIYIKNFEKFQQVFKNLDKQFSLCVMIDRKYEVVIRDKSFIFIGRFFNGWNINGLEDYIGSSVGNRRNNFIVTFINSKFDPYRNVSLYGTPDKIYAVYVGNSVRKNPEYFIMESKHLLPRRFLIDYNGRLYHGWINGNLTVSEATGLWNISFETHDYYEYDGKPIDQNLSITQIQNLPSTKIFTAKDRLNGGGKMFDMLKVKNVHEIKQEVMNTFAESMSANLLEEYMNEEGITNREVVEDCFGFSSIRKRRTYRKHL